MPRPARKKRVVRPALLMTIFLLVEITGTSRSCACVSAGPCTFGHTSSPSEAVSPSLKPCAFLAAHVHFVRRRDKLLILQNAGSQYAERAVPAFSSVFSTQMATGYCSTREVFKPCRSRTTGYAAVAVESSGHDPKTVLVYLALAGCIVRSCR